MYIVSSGSNGPNEAELTIAMMMPPPMTDRNRLMFRHHRAFSYRAWSIGPRAFSMS